jgi:(2S)-methylsuccinyl-CoA dehydrogenase
MTLRSHAPIAAKLLDRLSEAVNLATRHLAGRCARDGKLDPALLDAAQLPSFELAWANAELLAAQTALRAVLNGPTSELDQRLIVTFACEAITLVRDRLDALGAELDLTDGTALAVSSDPTFRSLQRSVLSGAAVCESARRMASDPAAIAQVALGEDLELIRDQFSRFARDAVAPMAQDIHRRDLTVPEELLRPMRAMGLFGLSIPERYGGSAAADDQANPAMIVVTEALSQASLGAAGSLITRPEILARALLAGGTEEQKQNWLPRLAQGDPLCAISITEPDCGSDVAAVTLQARPTQGGWLLDGAKTWCTFAGKAGVLMVVARTDPDRKLGHRGLSVLLAEKPSFDGHEFDYHQSDGGRLAGRAIATLGYRGMHSFDLAFENFFVPEANVLGGNDGLGRGFYYTMAGMTGGRLQTAARANGVMRASLLAALDYASQRKVFGAVLLEYPLTCAKLVKMAARYAVSRYLTFSTARLVDEAGRRMAASLVKLFACRCAELVTREALQIHGGMGYAEETAVSRYYVDARVLSIFEGAEETLALKVIARTLIEDAIRARAP